MTVIPVNKGVNEKRMIGKRGLKRRTLGCSLTPPPPPKKESDAME
jgi:hypothetical protein